MQFVRWSELASEKISDGVERQVIWGQRGTLARFVFHQGTHVSRHHHECEQHTCVLEGVLRVALAGEEITMRAGEVLVIPSGAEHEVWILEDSVVLDFFAPPRDDWRLGAHQYLQSR